MEAHDFKEGADALILGHFLKKPQELSEEDYITHFQAVDFHLKVQNRLMYNAFKKALAEVVNELFAQTAESF
uniref:hypothetical protein n=1 Tax=Ornithobacterium rhinotracheale TaxID=28251 RepID=UPI0039A6F322